MDGLEYQRKSAFKAPPKEWIEFRLQRLHETLGKNVTMAALALSASFLFQWGNSRSNKDLLGCVEMEPVPGECVVENGKLIESRGYYVAHTSIQTLALLDETKGSNWLQWRKR